MAVSMLPVVLWGDPVVSNVRAAQIEGTKRLQVTYDLETSAESGATVLLNYSKNGGVTWLPATYVYGAVGVGIAAGEDLVLYWEVGLDDPLVRVDDGQIQLRATNATGVVDQGGFALVPPGSFMRRARADAPAYEVTLTKSFFVQKRPVSDLAWKLVRDWALANGYTIGATGNDDASAHTRSASINWNDAVLWCNARSEMEGLTPVYYRDPQFLTVLRDNVPDEVVKKQTANGYRLPTEAEWEYAARAGTTGAFFTGEQAPASDVPNAFGLAGVHAQRNWCWDRFGSLPTHAVVDPLGPITGSGRVVRGPGSFYERSAGQSGRGSYSAGLRPVRTLIVAQE